MTHCGNLHFRNRRAEMYWMLREALDPTNPDPIALPPDAELLGDLTAVRYKVVTMGRRCHPDAQQGRDPRSWTLARQG